MYSALDYNDEVNIRLKDICKEILDENSGEHVIEKVFEMVELISNTLEITNHSDGFKNIILRKLFLSQDEDVEPSELIKTIFDNLYDEKHLLSLTYKNISDSCINVNYPNYAEEDVTYYIKHEERK